MSTFDYIVVGAGSAGAVVANRLSSDPAAQVLLVEAGGKGADTNVKIPAAFAKQFKTPLDWEYYTEPEPHLEERRVYHPRGKMLGGSSGQNAMIYIRGNRSDYDGWAEDGATGWSYDEVLPLFIRSERNSRGAGTFHGASGPQHIEDPRSPNPLSRRLVDAMVSSGIAANTDFNGAAQEGAGLYQVTQQRGSRWTTNDGYLRPARKRPNLTVMTEAQVTRVLIERGRAYGIEVAVAGLRRTSHATREVVLSAGAFGTPHLLMLSGVGPADHLTGHGIECVVDNPHVGAHLMDHPMYMLNYETSAKGTLANAESPVQLVKYLTARRGLLTSNIGEAGAFFHTRDGLDAPDMQLIGGPAYFRDHGFATHDGAALALGCSLVGSRSTGAVRLASGDPLSKPSVRFDYFSDPGDMEAMVTGIERAREVAASRAMGGLVGEEIHPGPAKRTRRELEQEIRAGVDHTYHPSCTARIGSETEGVVDASLRVHGIAGLRVADASVFPNIPHGNTHAPTMMVGEKACDLIKADR
ncbi:choline dehydrogenase-like flavoprotein [Actinopolyspora biskrensis]|uniref:Choline dehydrogenase-like flavoprotein n=1 Tax=Actinopolyspora biskrensis TaxID=1470178 RepID=A0A852Z4X4_9ACTN|nr:GMC family oxidoreductase N-terminal domain-containing protein [Actinopolyspora biskrensis]NYH77303.1 choline dehydrogenase-like flavoprotein [Actinopolyspora biskrensis]